MINGDAGVQTRASEAAEPSADSEWSAKAHRICEDVIALDLTKPLTGAAKRTLPDILSDCLLRTSVMFAILALALLSNTHMLSNVKAD